MTLRMLADIGLNDFMPTIVVMDTHDVTAISGIPPQVEHTKALQKSIELKGLLSQIFLFAVKSGPAEVTTGQCIDRNCTFAQLTKGTKGWDSARCEAPSWWWLH